MCNIPAASGISAGQNITAKESKVSKVKQNEVSQEKVPAIEKDSAIVTKQAEGNVPKGAMITFGNGEQITEAQFRNKIRNEKNLQITAGIGVITDMAVGGGVMLASKSLPGMLLGAGIFGTGCLITNINKTDPTAAATIGTISFTAASAFAAYKMSGSPVTAAITGAIAAGSGIYTIIKASE